MTRRYYSILIVGILALGACKKSVDKVKEDLMVNLITSNSWVITKYAEGTEDKTSTYNAYSFNFTKDWKVNAINGSTTEATGSWQGSETSQSITSNFPSAGSPINKLNGVWIVTNTKSSPWRVYSHRFDDSGKEIFLDLQAK